MQWYSDVWLPVAAGPVAYYGHNVRCYQTATDRRVIHGKEQANVNVISEAYGWINFENYREAWLEVFKFKKENLEKKVPQKRKDDPSTHKFTKTKWSDQRIGQGSGWDASVSEALLNHARNIKEIREEDKSRGWKIYKIAKDLVREKHNVTKDSPKKRGSGDAPRKVTPLRQKRWKAVDASEFEEV